ncbi:hypothetical protein CORC01_01297 [Colletotrichum orchidophilum]|uniref:Uncharacterized protein n=1 Tax=Colletotrichum orchidophilum TaxID=1209926 RepID=A0A1G4BQH9_9PEZI|nr:uncharacterized protein CORC01_01297 [Colletotrichum orchidophilum]OHF03578.1 hypothetical protein CORC01_01297 [Colletotrichum orchidophilum]
MTAVWLMADARLPEESTAKRRSHDPRTESTNGPRPSTYIITRRGKPSEQVQHRRPRRISPPTPPPVTIASLEMSVHWTCDLGSGQTAHQACYSDLMVPSNDAPGGTSPNPDLLMMLPLQGTSSAAGTGDDGSGGKQKDGVRLQGPK